MPLVRRPLARAAIVGGGAYAAGKRRAATEQQQAAPAAPGPAPAASGSQTDVTAKLKQLQELQESGALTPEQFEAAKQKVLQGQ